VLQKKRYTQEEIYSLNKVLEERLEDIINYFHLDVVKKRKIYVGKCPVHEGSDNTSSFNLYHSGDIIGNWYCRTHQCEKTFKSTAIGLVRGLLSHQNGWRSLKDKDKITSFPATLEFTENFLGDKVEQIDSEEFEKNRFTNTFKPHKRNGHAKYSRIYLRSRIKIPAEYYINRGYSKEILDKYDVGLCDDPEKPFFQRIVIPIYNDDYSYIVGYTARSILECCSSCGYYHNKTEKCPQKINQWMHTKWLNNKGFNKQDYLFNYWFAKNEIKRTGKVILVEGPGDVLRLVQAGVLNVLGLFGTILTDSQKFVLDCSGAVNIIVITDNDIPGEFAAEQIIKKCQKLYYVRKFDWQNSEFRQFKDIGEIPVELLQEKKQILEL
jgi:5S rRNA maturation endonuclease (ribonuclease M5)